MIELNRGQCRLLDRQLQDQRTGVVRDTAHDIQTAWSTAHKKIVLLIKQSMGLTRTAQGQKKILDIGKSSCGPAHDAVCGLSGFRQAVFFRGLRLSFSSAMLHAVAARSANEPRHWRTRPMRHPARRIAWHESADPKGC